MPRALSSEARPDRGWTTEVFARTAEPPLRISCRCLDRHALRLAGGRELFVALWECRRGGFVLAHSTPDGLAETALEAADLEAAMAGLESYCAGLESGGWPPEGPPAGAPLAALLDALARRDAGLHGFLVLAGEALDRWQGAAAGAALRHL